MVPETLLTAARQAIREAPFVELDWSVAAKVEPVVFDVGKRGDEVVVGDQDERALADMPAGRLETLCQVFIEGDKDGLARGPSSPRGLQMAGSNPPKVVDWAGWGGSGRGGGGGGATSCPEVLPEFHGGDPGSRTRGRGRGA